MTSNRGGQAPDRLVLAAVACAFLTSCSADSGPREIHGQVTLDGQPVKNGNMRFAPLDGKTAAGEGIIKEGKYTAKLALGTYKVEIYASRPTGKKVKGLPGPGEEREEVEETIPLKYNVNSKLKVDVTAHQDAYDFPLTRK